MYCRICGDERGTRYYTTKRQTLCRSCATDTPSKVGRASFERVYWAGGDVETVPDPIRRDFYEDYLRSGDTLHAYRDHTTEG